MEDQIYTHSTTLVQYPFVQSSTQIKGHKVIFNFVHNHEIHIPHHIILDSHVRIIIVPVNSSIDLFTGSMRARIIRRIRDACDTQFTKMTPVHDVRVILPRIFISRGSALQSCASNVQYEYIDMTISDAVRAIR
jgi:hypothetical protein